jgi:hypothetical protein
MMAEQSEFFASTKDKILMIEKQVTARFGMSATAGNH